MHRTPQVHNRYFSNIKERHSPYESSFRPRTTYRENRNISITQVNKKNTQLLLKLQHIPGRFVTSMRKRSLINQKKDFSMSDYKSKELGTVQVIQDIIKKSPNQQQFI